ncbi:hypothetical protein RDI58_017592 [Solanum bulbocastanum]|uniref:Uncharacterized protein n=1 Tax=Solanum bulbocastanum TaxID=147425 RepID=A0AAN8YC57_SOLBU
MGQLLVEAHHIFKEVSQLEDSVESNRFIKPAREITIHSNNYQEDATKILNIHKAQISSIRITTRIINENTNQHGSH